MASDRRHTLPARLRAGSPSFLHHKHLLVEEADQSTLRDPNGIPADHRAKKLFEIEPGRFSCRLLFGATQKLSLNAICICRDEFETAVIRPNVPAPTVTFGLAK